MGTLIIEAHGFEGFSRAWSRGRQVFTLGFLTVMYLPERISVRWRDAVTNPDQRKLPLD